MKEQEIETNMKKSIEATQRNFNTIRTGRANASLLDRVSVEYYGAETPIKSLATVATVDSQTISIQPFDLVNEHASDLVQDLRAGLPFLGPPGVP